MKTSDAGDQQTGKQNDLDSHAVEFCSSPPAGARIASIWHPARSHTGRSRPLYPPSHHPPTRRKKKHLRSPSSFAIRGSAPHDAGRETDPGTTRCSCNLGGGGGGRGRGGDGAPQSSGATYAAAERSPGRRLRRHQRWPRACAAGPLTMAADVPGVPLR